MKALLDTNIVIHRENQIASNYSIGHLFRWLDKLQISKVIHPKTIEEIRRYQHPHRRSALEVKLNAYEQLEEATRPSAKFLSLLPDPANENDQVDNALLYEVYEGYVDLLITEDKKLRAKSRLLGIEDRVRSIESIIGSFSEEHPELIEYKMLAVELRQFRQINLNDPFFDSFRHDYAEFDQWFRSKSTEYAYVCMNQDGSVLGFLYLKTEDRSEDYRDICPAFAPAKRLKVGTLKVESTGFRLGERFLQLIFDNALMRQVDGVYLTIVPDSPDRPEIAELVRLIESWGFRLHGEKVSANGKERVFVKPMKSYDDESSIKENYPNLKFYGRKKRFLPIFPQFHTNLFPDAILRNENPRDYASNVGFRYALQKMYITWSPLRDTRIGDYVLVYRTGSNPGKKGYESVVSTLGVITDLKGGFRDWEDFQKYCSNRTVFTEDDLRGFWSDQSHRRHMTVVSFIYVRRLSKRPILKDLWENGIVPPPSGPRTFQELSDDDFLRVLDWAETSIQFVDEV